MMHRTEQRTERSAERDAPPSASRWIAPTIGALLPWMWFGIRDADPVMNPIATLLPIIAATAGVATLGWVLLTGRTRFALVAFSLALLAVVVVLEPRLPQHSPVPVTPFRVGLRTRSSPTQRPTPPLRLS